ncbi:beta-L-arabinofuranosidase domain-containing protein [Paenibacillus polymyxa]|uniref:beta-L-arabinofuranosidase domain-containing protein n=1 Tax=Paenibacillus polymyxa TaxID=1406 RepID=UPI002AB4D9DA|nr:beta-L-arabinofuranosidase domain-containing protein [Paenibacillus polymyxa]MDY8023284.1 glycoside hydrolase family 127 protein [Paenibacillus polymyxa]
MELKQNAVKSAEAKERMEMDGNAIYLGNLNTVEADLKLPQKGKYGSSIQWESKETLFISHTGKVTRPTFGVGNRKVALVATLTYGGEVTRKTFEATVLQEEYKAKIIAVNPLTVCTNVGEQPELSTVVIVKNDTGSYTVSQVSWDPIKKEAFRQAGFFPIHGKVEGSTLKAMATIQVMDEIGETAPHTKRLKEFKGHDVRLEKASEFGAAMDRFLQYVRSVDDDQMLYNFRAAAAFDTKGAQPMTGWDAPECNLKGHTTGHYLSALALAYNATEDSALLGKIQYMVAELGKCQTALSEQAGYGRGFLSAYSEEQFNLLEQYTTYPEIWAPYYTLHKIMAGLLDCYQLAGQREALDICDKLGHWIYNRLSRLPKEQLHKMWSLYIAGEFGGMNEVLAKLYAITSNENYLMTAKYFDNEKLFLPMKENVDTLGNMHANQHIPQVIGALKLFEVTGDKAYFNIAENFWTMVTQSHIYPIGGTGETEMFREPDAIAGFLSDKTAETCASYNMLKLTKELFQFNPRKTYMDYYEKALYNHILASENSQKAEGGSTYFMPLAPGSIKKFDTHENTCCHGTGLENHFKYQEAIYFHDQDRLYVNLYIPSRLDWSEHGLSLMQNRDRDGLERFRFYIEGGPETTLMFRIPDWVSEPIKVKINGESWRDLELEHGYLKLRKVWIKDEIELTLPCSLRLVDAPDNHTLKSLAYGPYVLAAISEEQDYISWTYSEQEFLEQIIQQKDNPLTFVLDGVKFVPLYQIQDESYHVYFKLAR